MWFVLFFVSCTSLVTGYGNDEILTKKVHRLIIGIEEDSESKHFDSDKFSYTVVRDAPHPAGKGRWFIISILQCDDADQYDMQFEITRRKINRTHDAFSLHSGLDREINVTYGVDVIADKEVDGGFKFYHQITDESFCNMAKKYGGDNLEQLLTKANIDPPDCPIPEGEFIIDDFVVDYTQLEETGMYGTFDTCVYLTYAGQRISCIRLLAQFEKQREDDDDDDED